MNYTEIWNDGYNIYAGARNNERTEREAQSAARECLLCHVEEDELLAADIPQMLEDFKETYNL